MKIVHVAETAKGGVGTYINHIVPLQNALYGQGSVRVIAPAEHQDQLPSLDPTQIISFPRPMRSGASLLALTDVIRSVCTNVPPDLIHAHSTFAGAIVRLMYGWRRDRPAIVYCPHGWAFNIQGAEWKKQAAAVFERVLSPLSDRIIAVSEQEAIDAQRIGLPAKRVTVVRNAIPLAAPVPAEARWDDPRRKVLFIGRLDKQKGFDVLMKAVQGLENSIAVRVAGEAVLSGPSMPRESNVEFLGWLTPGEVQGQLLCCDLVVMPSRWEGLSLTALEAMRAGKPVYATAIGGLSEVIIDGVTGRLTPPDDVQALQQALLIDDEPSMRLMGERGRRRFVEEFTIGRMHDGLSSLYAQLRV